MREQFACMVRVQSCCMCAGFARESERPARRSETFPFFDFCFNLGREETVYAKS